MQAEGLANHRDQQPSTLLGDRHKAAVDQLLAEFRAVEDGDARLVCLVGATGHGKTRIVQEFYARLALDQPRPHYWPASLQAGGGPDMKGILEDRKRVYPALVNVPKGAEIPWMWWAVLCQRRPDGTLSQAMFDDATQLFAHGDSLLNRVSTKSAAGRAVDAGGAVVGLLGLLGVALFPPAGVALGVVGAARTGWQNRDLVKRVQAFRQRQEERSLNGAGHGRGQHVRDMAASLIALSKAVPVILIIDDAQFADATLVDTLSIVLRAKGARVLAVATVWKQELDDPNETAPFPSWWHTKRSDREKTVTIRVEVEALDQADARELVRRDLTALEAESDLTTSLSDRLITRWGTNPLVLRTLIRLPRVRAALRDGDLTEAGLEELPHQVEAILSEYWSTLPDRVRQVLSIASFFGFEFLPEVVAMGATRCGYSGSSRAIADAVEPFAWVRPTYQMVYAFVERSLWEIAERGAAELMGTVARDEVVAALADYVRTRNFDVIPERTAVVAWSQHVRLARAGLIPVDEEVVESTIALAHYRAKRLQFAQAAEVALWLVARNVLTAKRELAFRLSAGTWFRQIGHYKSSLEQLQTCERLLEPWDQAGQALVCHALGATYRYLGHLEAAVASFKVALEYFDDGGDIRGSANALYGLGDASRGLCQWEVSDAALQRCIEIYRDLDDEIELACAQIRYAMLLRDRYRFPAARPLIDTALSTFVSCRDRLWEARALRNRGVIARNNGDPGLGCEDLSAALVIFVELGDVRSIAVTLRNRADAIRLNGELGRAEDELGRAQHMFEALGDERWVARTRVSLADIYRRTGRYTLALRAVRTAVAVSEQTGDRHGIGRARRAEGLVLRDMGDVDAAARAFEAGTAIFASLGDIAWRARAMAGAISLGGAGDAQSGERREEALALCIDLTGNADLAQRILTEW